MLRRCGAILALSISVTFAAPVTAADLNFCWIGGGGYTMTGTMRIPDAKMNKPMITETDVTQFKITGFLHGARIGGWSMANRADDATWHLRFDPASMTFLTGGSFSTLRSQGWNADGNVVNCGNPGFGFNSGNYAQDICLNGVYIHDSSIDPETPLSATTAAVEPSCGEVIILGKQKTARKP